MAKFILVLRDDPTQWAKLSPAEMQGVIEKYSAWSAGLAQRGAIRGGEKLTNDGGKHLRRQGGALSATDGPYNETKEVIGGFFIIEAADYDEAVALCADCPHLEHGWIELRQVEHT